MADRIGNLMAAVTLAFCLASPLSAEQSLFWLQKDPNTSQLGTITNPVVNLPAGQTTQLYLWFKPVGLSSGLDGVSFDVRLIGSGTAEAEAHLVWDMPAGRWSGATGGMGRTDSGGTGVDDANAFDLTNTDTLGTDPLRLATINITGVTRGMVQVFLCIGAFGVADGGNDSVVWLGFDTGLTTAEPLNISGGAMGSCSNVPEAIINVLPGLPDWDGDGDVDQEDFGRFQACMTGPIVAQTDPACAPALLDDDNNVDSVDLQIFRQCFSGPNQPADPDCVIPQ